MNVYRSLHKSRARWVGQNLFPVLPPPAPCDLGHVLTRIRGLPPEKRRRWAIPSKSHPALRQAKRLVIQQWEAELAGAS